MRLYPSPSSRMFTVPCGSSDAQSSTYGSARAIEILQQSSAGSFGDSRTLVVALGCDSYFEGWLSPRRFSRSRRRRCNGVGVFGLNATKYHSGLLRSPLSHASVLPSAFAGGAQFSRFDT